MPRRRSKYSPPACAGIRRQGSHIRPGYERSRVSGRILRQRKRELARMPLSTPVKEKKFTTPRSPVSHGYGHTFGTGGSFGSAPIYTPLRPRSSTSVRPRDLDVRYAVEDYCNARSTCLGCVYNQIDCRGGNPGSYSPPLKPNVLSVLDLGPLRRAGLLPK